MENKTIILDGNEYELVPKVKVVMKEKTGIKLLKGKYSSGDYICCVKGTGGYYFSIEQPEFNVEVEKYKLTHKKHESILKAYLDNPKVKIEVEYNTIDFEPKWFEERNFIENYDETFEYKLKEIKKQFEPFDLNIRINTLEEAKSMWNRLNPCDEGLIEALSKTNNDYFTSAEEPISLYSSWSKLRSIINEYDEEQLDRNYFGKNIKEDTKVTNIQEDLSKICSKLLPLGREQILVSKNISGDIVSNRDNTYEVYLNFTISTLEDK